MIDSIEWLGHASFRIAGPPLIYIDPWRVVREGNAPEAILVSHDHYDHCSPADIEKLCGPETLVLANPNAAALLPGARVMRPWQVFNIGRACIKTVPAYNSHHPREFECLGFVISLNHYDIYFAGDTGLIPEMNNLRADIAILPIGGRQTMGVEDAAEAVRILRPRWVIPSHWGTASEGGTVVDVKAFARSLELEGLAELVVPERVR
jgi:L-ascorbate metabolism protein UlaG (beta-lactamase superfamily)